VKVRDVLELLAIEDPESEVMIAWVTKAHVERDTGLDVGSACWSVAVELFEKWGNASVDPREVEAALAEAAERLAALAPERF
jgi:hypothetical protein